MLITKMAKGDYAWQSGRYVRDLAKATMRDAFGRHPDYRLLCLMQAAQAVAPFKTMITPYKERRDSFDNRRKGGRHWANRECFVCMSREYIHVHHIVPLVNGGTNEECNLVNVCRDCHSRIHGFPVGSDYGKERERVEDRIEFDGAKAGI